jgi:SAM-dependent methyltransferase
MPSAAEPTGPGAHAPDGSPVELYLLLPPLGEAQIIHSALAAEAEILELGCGVGRVTHELLALGHRVVAVDQSAEMLRHVRGAETVLAEIETLQLGRRFGGVVLASNLINVSDPGRRAAFLRTCSRHVAPAGSVLIERHPPDWAPAEAAARELGGVRVSLRQVSRGGPRVTALARYEAGGRVWSHRFTAEILDDEQLAAALADVGLAFERRLDDSGSWVEARPVQP